MQMAKRNGMSRAAWGRGISLLLMAATIPACSYSSSGHSYMAPTTMTAPAGSTTLLSDQFVTFPGGNWTTPLTTNGATVTDVFTGSEYHLVMNAPTRTAGTAPSALTRTTSSFNSPTVTLSVDIQASAVSTVGDVGSVVIENAATHAIMARADLDANTMMLNVSISGPVTGTPVSAGIFYRVTFKVDSKGNATWTVAGGAPTTGVIFPSTMVDMALQANWADGTPTPSPEFLFRDVLVTSP
jgi:hypothetical protein